MTALETIQEAIAELERLDAESTQGEWVVEKSNYSSEYGDYEGARIPNVLDDVSDYYIGTVPVVEAGDADLIASLHRSIPALLEILSCGLDEDLGIIAYDHAEILAKAILGRTE